MYSFDVITNPKTLSLGECGVANLQDKLGFKLNPAVLIETHGPHFYYLHRPMNWTRALEGMYYYSLGTFMKTPLGTFAFDYTRHTEGGFTLITVEHPGGTNKKVKLYNHTYTLGYARLLCNQLGFGINFKVFDVIIDYPDKRNPYNSSATLLSDFGLLYVMKQQKSQQLFSHQLILGFSLQNVGEKHAWSYKSELREWKGKEVIPSYLRFGFCYEFIGHEDKNWIPFQFSWIGDYKKYLNPSKQHKSETNYYGFGLEATLYQIFSLRMGGMLQPYNDIYGEEKRVTFRGGMGIQMPLKRFSIELPIIIQFDYAYLPIFSLDYTFSNSKRNLNIWGIHLNYVF